MKTGKEAAYISKLTSGRFVAWKYNAAFRRQEMANDASRDALIARFKRLGYVVDATSEPEWKEQ